MPDLDDYHAFQSTGDNGGGSGSGGDLGCGWVVIVIVGYFLIQFIADGFLEGIGDLLAYGYLAFLFARNLFR